MKRIPKSKKVNQKIASITQLLKINAITEALESDKIVN